MQHVKFYKIEDEHFVELCYKNNSYKNVIHWDFLTGVGDDSITVRYPLSGQQFKDYQTYLQQIDSILVKHDLLGKTESKYHHSNILFVIIEFHRQYKNFLADKARDARLNNMIDFLKRIKPLNQAERQQVKMSFQIKNELFTFEDQPILSEIVINKLFGVLMNNICQLYPELYEKHLKRGSKPKVFKDRVTSDSKLQNQAVADITKILISYLNQESTKLKSHRANPDKLTLTSKQGEFIYDLLVELEIYKPRKVSKTDTSGKEAYYHGLRKLIDQYR